MDSTTISKEPKAKDIVNKYVLYSATTGFIPVPFADIAALIAVQMKLVETLSTLYKVPYDETKTKSRIYALLGAVGTNTLASSFFRSLIKGIPGIGSLVGTVTMPVAAGAITYGIGQLFINHFSSGGTLSNLPVEKIKPFFQTKVKEGMEVTKRLQQESKAQSHKPVELPVIEQETVIDLEENKKEPTSAPATKKRVYCILKPKLGKAGKVYLKGYYQGKRPEKYIGTIPELKERYQVDELDSVKSQIIEDYLHIYEAFLEERYLKIVEGE